MADLEYGWVTISEFVTDGVDTWLETQRYLYYSPKQARRLYEDYIKSRNWTIKED